jgi:hypothetical protein
MRSTISPHLRTPKGTRGHGINVRLTLCDFRRAEFKNVHETHIVMFNYVSAKLTLLTKSAHHHRIRSANLGVNLSTSVWGAMNGVYEKDFISNPVRKAKSVGFSDDEEA